MTGGSRAREAPRPSGELEELARRLGVQPTYTTAAGEERTADPDALLAVLRAIGAPVEGHGDVADALRSRAAARGRRLLPPVAVAWEGGGGSVPLHVMEDEVGDDARCHLITQDGDTLEWDGDLDTSASEVVEGRTVLRASLELPADMPRGYHDLDVSIGGRDARCRIIAAPATTWTPEGGGSRGWGAFLPLYALRSGRSWGTGDLTDLETLERWVSGLGGEIVGTLPIFASFLDEPLEPSPYAPVSRLFWNELYLDPERAPGWEEAEAAPALRASAEVQDAIERLRGSPEVDYREAAAVKRRVLEALTADVAPTGSRLPDGLALFAETRPEALAYARFRAAGERYGRGWREWPASARDGTLDQEDWDEGVARYHLYAQWAMDEALRGLRKRHSGLYLDLPLGTHADGFDVWRFRELFAAGASAGAPPDAFFAGGQDWGIPPLHPERGREEHHAYWAASLRRLMSASAMVRLDHVMAMHRLYWVPEGFPATEGVYVRYPAEELYAVLCLESHRQRCEVVGEDLGTVPGEVRDTMERHGLRRMYVLPFELEEETNGRARLGRVPTTAVASLGTHDTPTWSGFWRGADIEARVDDGQLDADRAPTEREERAGVRAKVTEALEIDDDGEEEAFEGALRFLAASPARLLLVSLEDLWGETEPQNRPGTTGGSNWRRKAAHDLEEIQRMDRVRTLLQEVDALRRDAGKDGGGARERPRDRSRDDHDE